MKRIKIVHVIESASGGSLSYLVDLCWKLNPKEFDITIVYSRRDDTPLCLEGLFPKNINFVQVEMCREISLFKDMRAIYSLRRIVDKIAPTVVHLHSSKAGAVGRLALLGKNIPLVIYTPHGYAFFRRDVPCWKRGFYWMIEKLLSLLAPCSTVVGSAAEKRQGDKLADPQTVHLIYNSVSIPPMTRSVGINSKQIVTVGRLTPAKNPIEVLRVVSQLQKIEPGVNLVWVGDGEMRTSFEKKAKIMGLSVYVTGWLPKVSVYEWVLKSHVYLQTSLWEGMPLALLEAMALGKPVVVSDITAHRDIIRHGITGLLASSTEQFVQDLICVFNDLSLADELGANAQRLVEENYSGENSLNQLLNIYKSIQT